MPTGGTQQFTATGLDQYGNPMSTQPTFTWSVSGGGTISTSGPVHGRRDRRRALHRDRGERQR